MADDSEFKVYVGSLPFNTTDERLANYFMVDRPCGKVTEARVIIDRDTRRSRGFGFVTFEDSEAFAKALDLNGSEFDGRTITVSKANARTGGGRGGGGGYGRGGRNEYGAGGGSFGGGGSSYGYNQGSYGGSGGSYGAGGGRRHGGADYSGGGGYGGYY